LKREGGEQGVENLPGKRGGRYTESVKREVGEVSHLVTRQTIFFLTPKADNRHFIKKKFEKKKPQKFRDGITKKKKRKRFLHAIR